MSLGRRPGWPFSLLSGLLPFVILLVASFLSNRPSNGSYAEWVGVSAALHEGLLVTGPIIALWAGSLGHYLANRNWLFHSQAARRRLQQLTYHVSRVALAAALAIALGQIPAWIWAAKTASWGGLDVWDVCQTIAGLAMITVLAFVGGSYLPRPPWLLLVPVATIVLLLSPRYSSRALSVIDPVQSWTSSVRFSPNPATAIYLLVFAATVVASATVLFALQGRALPLPVIGLTVACLAILAAIPFAWRPDLYILRTDPAPICELVSGTTICVHPAHANSMPVIAESVGAVNAIAGVPLVLEVTDQSAVDTFDNRVGHLIINVSPILTSVDYTSQIVLAGTGQYVCGEKYPRLEGNGEPAVNISIAVGVRLLRETGDEVGAAQMSAALLDQTPLDQITRISEDDFRRLVGSNKAVLEQCALTKVVFS